MKNKSAKFERHISKAQRNVDRKTEVLMKYRDFRMWAGLISLGLFIYSVLNQSTAILIISSVGLFLIFPIFVKVTGRIQTRLKTLENWVKFLQRQKHRHLAQWEFVDKGKKNQIQNDLDTLGWPSLYMYLDETVSKFGELKLEAMVQANSQVSAEQIRSDQKMVIELSKHFFHIRHLLLTSWNFPERFPSQKMVDFIKNPLVGPGYSKRVSIASGLWAVAVLAYPLSQSVAIWPAPPILLILYWIYSASQLGEVVKGFQSALSIDKNYHDFSSWLSQLESTGEKCDAVGAICPRTLKKKPSKQLKTFSRIISYLSVQANPLVFVGINAIFPWTLVFTWLLEGSRKKLENQIEDTMNEIADLESYWCRTILFKFHTQTMPTINDSPTLEVERIIHPLISPDQVIANDFQFSAANKIGLITGSNMSGKSTFLRTLGLNQALAICGAPVFAQSMTTWPARVQSCLRIADSVEDGYSYFYSEVRRIKEIIQSLEAGETLFYLVDEVFKGTNNRERLIAAKSLLNRLSGYNALGFVTTHDLELAELESSIACLKNFHFSDRFEDGEMKFDYTVKQGPCTSTNALRILENEGLPIS